MTVDKLELACRAVACRGWRWMPGMVDLDGVRMGLREMSALPDLDDPATLGCLLALVRDAWGDPSMHTRRATRRLAIVWAVFGYGTSAKAYGVGDTEAEALVAALEAAP